MSESKAKKIEQLRKALAEAEKELEDDKKFNPFDDADYHFTTREQQKVAKKLAKIHIEPNSYKATKNIKKNKDKFIIKNNDEELARIQLYKNIKLLGITHDNEGNPIKKFPQGNKTYWLKLWKSAAPKVKHVKIVEFKQRQLAAKNDKTKLVLSAPERLELKMLFPTKKGNRYTGLITYRAEWKISSDIRIHNSSLYIKNATEKQIEKLVDDDFLDYIGNTGFEWYKLEINLNINKDIMTPVKFGQMVLKTIEYVKLSYEVQANNAIIQNHCVKDHLLENAKKYRLWGHKEYIENKDIWTVDDLKGIFGKSSRNFSITDQWFKNEWKHTSNDDGVINRFVCANNHLYYITPTEYRLMKSKYYKSIPITKIEKIDVKKLNMPELIKKSSIPSIKVNMHTKEITNFVSDGVMYIDNDTAKAYDLFKKIGLIDQMELTSKFTDMDPFIFVAKKNKLFSSVNQTMNKPKAIFINNSKDIDVKNVFAIDRNIAYTYEFMTLPYIPKMTSRNMEKIYDNHPIIETNLYYIRHVSDDALLDYIKPHNWCSGYRLDAFKENVVITKFIEPELIENPFCKIIKEMLAVDRNTTKFLVNKFIGYVQRIENVLTVDKIVCDKLFTSENEKELTDYIELEENLYLSYKIKTINKRFSDNMLPLSHYVFDRHVSALYKQIQYLTTNKYIDKLVCVKTDSIAYTGKKFTQVSTKPGEWKSEKYVLRENIIGQFQENDTETTEIQIIDPKDIDSHLQGLSNIIIDGFAGAGKSYFILNEVIPRLQKNNKSFIIACSQHQPLIQYITENYTCKTIGSLRYGNQKRMPADVIIIDEASLCSFDDYEYLWSVASHDQSIILLGDHNQLSPVDPSGNDEMPLLNNNIRKMFNYEYKLEGNFRNKYTIEEYEQMIEGSFVPTEYELARHNQISEYNLCWTNQKRREINEICTKNWKDEFCGLKVEIGGKLLCKDLKNKLRDKEITNNMLLTIVSYDATHLTVYNGHINITLDINEFQDSGIEHGYGLTLYCAQGRTIPYDKISFWETEKYKHYKGALYTAYSRIQDK
jgi:hypothetical protein